MAQFHQCIYVFKNSVKLSVSFMLLGSTGAKAARKMLMKLAPGDWRRSRPSRGGRRTLRSVPGRP
jgi:hypothetical protein